MFFDGSMLSRSTPCILIVGSCTYRDQLIVVAFFDQPMIFSCNHDDNRLRSLFAINWRITGDTFRGINSCVVGV